MYILILGEWWAALAGIEKVFWGISIVFSVLFFIQFILSLLGLDFDTDTDLDTDGMESGLDADFTILSVRSFIAFFSSASTSNSPKHFTHISRCSLRYFSSDFEASLSTTS